MPLPYLLTIDGQMYGFHRSAKQAMIRVTELFPKSKHYIKIYDERGGLSVLVEDYFHNPQERSHVG